LTAETAKMKKIIFIISLIICIYSDVKAEYNGQHFTFIIQTNQGESIKAYNYVADGYFSNDSIGNQAYLLRVLGYPTSFSDDSFTFFQDRISYTYNYPGDPNKEEYKVFQLIQEKSILKSEIQKITITDKFEFTYSVGIHNELNASDRSWMISKPRESVNYGVYLCEYLIFVHKPTKTTRLVLEELKKLSTEYIGEDLEDAKLEEYAEAFQLLLKKLTSEQVVIVAGCSC
jgi:hypothetical protein